MKKLLLLMIAFGIISCSDDSGLEDHLLIGNYLGSWKTVQGLEIESMFSIESYNNGLVLFYSLADSSDLNIVSNKEFTIDRYVQNGYSNGVSGVLVEDTLFMQNEVFLVSDQMNTQTIRTGKFAKQ